MQCYGRIWSHVLENSWILTRINLYIRSRRPPLINEVINLNDNCCSSLCTACCPARVGCLSWWTNTGMKNEPTGSSKGFSCHSRASRLTCGVSNWKITREQVGRGADKSLARPWRKQATATKLGIYSIHSPRSSIHFLARCCNFCKPLKKIQKFIRSTRSPRQQWPPRRTKNGDLSIVFFSSQGTGDNQ